MKRRALIIFTRVPYPGETKTRLMPYFTPKQCRNLHICFLKDIAKMCEKTDADIFICHTPEDKDKILHHIFGEKTEYFLQVGEGLGERMYAAIDAVLKKGYEACILMGTDVPEVRKEDIQRAFELLESKDVVFAPVADGGYYLVGMKMARKEVFEQKTYGHGNVLEDTMCGLNKSGVSVGLVEEKHDIDTRDDIRLFRERMRKNPALQTSETGKYLMRTSTTTATSIGKDGGDVTVTITGENLPDTMYYKRQYVGDDGLGGTMNKTVDWSGQAVSATGTATEKTISVPLPAVTSSSYADATAWKISVALTVNGKALPEKLYYAVKYKAPTGEDFVEEAVVEKAEGTFAQRTFTVNLPAASAYPTATAWRIGVNTEDPGENHTYQFARKDMFTETNISKEVKGNEKKETNNNGSYCYHASCDVVIQRNGIRSRWW